MPSVRELDYNRDDLPPTVHYVGPCPWFPPATQSENDWLNSVPRDLPWVHVTEGTSHYQDPFLLRAASTGLDGHTGASRQHNGRELRSEAARPRPLAGNVHLTRWLSHGVLLPQCAVVVTTGGPATILAALGAGVPLVVVPTSWDKPDNARRVVESGVGVRLRSERCSPGRLRAAVLEVLRDPGYRVRAGAMARTLAEAPGPARAADLLENLAPASTSRPTTRPGSSFSSLPLADRNAPMNHSSRRRHRRLALLLAALVGIAFVVPARSSFAGSDQGVRRLMQGGFSEGAKNSYSWSMAWFKNKLYVGTARSQHCVEAATYDFYFPGQGYYTKPAPDLSCPADRYDLDLRAQIWQYTPASDTWRMVYQAPADIPNPRAPGKFVSRDIGYRGMTVYTEPDGTSALYVGGVTANEYIPELAAANPPRLLRTTDGEHFGALAGGPGYIDDHAGRKRPMGFRALTPFHGRLYVTATSGLLGDGVVMEVRNPAGPSPEYVQVSPPSMRVFEMAVFNDNLYLGAGSPEAGYSVWRTDTKGSPSTFVPITTGGAGRGKTIDSVVSMHTYQGRLYVGASGWSDLLPGSELIRISRDDRWELVVGNPRRSEGRLKWPTSGLFDGFGNIFNAHFWRMSKDKGGRYPGPTTGATRSGIFRRSTYFFGGNTASMYLAPATEPPGPK